MSTLPRTLKNLWKVGFRDAAHQLQNIGDTKAGTLIGIDRYGNKYYENNDELPLRTRWVDYKDAEYDASQIEPGWHAWMSYMTKEAPVKDKAGGQTGVRSWELKEHRPVMTFSRSSYRPYNTVKPKVGSWAPVAKARS